MAQIPDTFNAQPRTPGNKGHARRLRASGWVPAVAYGPKTEPVHLAVNPKTFLAARFEYGEAHVYDVDVEGGENFKALVKSVDRDPVSRRLNHLDLYALDMTQPVELHVRIDLTGKPKGLLKGGMLSQVLRRIELSCLPKDIPSHLEVSVADLDLGESLHLSDLSLPEGVTLVTHEDEAIAIVAAPTGLASSDDDKPAEGEEVAAAEPAAK